MIRRLVDQYRLPVEDGTAAVLDAEDGVGDRAGAEVGEGGIGRDHLKRDHVRRADVDRRIGRDTRAEPELGRLADHRLFAQLHAQLDGDDVA